MKIDTGKNEVALVCDKGNGYIRYIQNVQSIVGDKFVGTMKIINIPHIWKPEGLSILKNLHTAAISESTKIFILTFDASLTSGQLVQIVDNLQSPHGLCLSPQSSDKLLVADGNSVVEVDIIDKSVHIVKQGFHKAFDVAVSGTSNTVGVTDVYSDKLHMLTCERINNEFKTEKIIGISDGCLDGPSSKAQLAEPVGLCFDMETVIVCCFSGTSNGCIKLYTSLSFTCNFMTNIRQIYVPLVSSQKLSKITYNDKERRFMCNIKMVFID